VDIGESLVGAYFRHVVGCEVVTYNNYFATAKARSTSSP
jgi:hypothetical protein